MFAVPRDINSRWKAVLDGAFAIQGTLYELEIHINWFNSQLRRMLFEWHGILQFISQSGFSFDSAFFFLSLFSSILWLF